MLFFTEYAIHGKTFGSHIFAANQKECDALIKLRNLGEKPVGSTQNDAPCAPVSFYDFHYIGFLSYLALKSGIYTVDEVWGDLGWAHGFVHCMQIPDEPLIEPIEDVMAHIFLCELSLGMRI